MRPTAPRLDRHDLLSLIALLAVVTPALAASGTKCYWPSSAEATDSVPCLINPAQRGNSPCCSPHDLCLTNGYCFTPGWGIIYRGACTDSTWHDSVCPTAFLREHPNGSASMANCLGSPYFQVDSGSCATPGNYKWTGAEMIFPPSATTTITASASAAAATATATVTKTAGAAASQKARVSCDVAGARRSTGVAVGLGVGLSLLALSVALAALWRLERRKRLRMLDDARQATHAHLASLDSYYAEKNLPPPTTGYAPGVGADGGLAPPNALGYQAVRQPGELE
ncbi:MAG: hypothetical protein M1826_004376 [Phylliscum demangeonii]|nr:MAG: hypothetical protein M1826_004376 [Phylliscum demangeonii]